MAFIEAKEIDLRGALSTAQDAYKVPKYQRTYTWGEKQWEDLHEDVVNLGEEDNHFLGSIVVVPGESYHRFGLNYFETVDGQQRLGTVLLWLAAIRDTAIEKGERGLGNHIEDMYLFAKDWQEGKEIKVPKLELGELDKEAFERVLMKRDRKGFHFVYECYDFFKKNLENEDLENVLNNLLGKVSIVHVNAFNHFNAFRLFETLNDRGLALSAADLIKNFILMRVAGKPKVFNQMIQEWNEMYDTVRDYDPVKFIRRYVLSTIPEKISERRLYEKLSNRIEDESWDEWQLLEFSKDMNRKAPFYRSICEASHSSLKIKDALIRLQQIEAATSYPLLLKILPWHEQSLLTEQDILDIMDMIEVFHIKWGVCGQSTARLDSIYNEICCGQDEPIEPDTVVENVKITFGEEIRKHASDKLFELSFSTRPFKPHEPRTKYVLWKLCEGSGETEIVFSEVEMEHIMPQTLTKKWKDYLVEQTGYDEEDVILKHQEKLHLIGNLAIIKSEWNRSMSNRLFENKTDDYGRSDFSITKQLASFDNWEFKSIKRRAEKLAITALSVWNWD